ncbi:MAG TPA: M1 family aminopeptidase [Symbiobacteriaceae bacterium]|nr:M1 family aminopeptidase [Symbiobacteriaceae bacterium]
MRKWMTLLVAALLIAGCAKEPQEKAADAIAERLFGPGDPGEVVARELADPASAWWQDLQNPADGPARIRQESAYRAHLTYKPAERLLTGETGIIFTNRDVRPVKKIYLGAIARGLGDAESADERWSLSDLRVDGKAASHKTEEDHTVISLPKPLVTGKTVVITFAFTAHLPVRSSEPQFGQVWSYGVDSSRATGLTEALPLILTDMDTMDHQDGRIIHPGTVARDIRLTLPADWRVLSSGSTIGTEQQADGQQQVRIVSAGQSFALFVTDALEQVSSEAKGVRLIVHYRKGDQAGAEALLADMANLLAAHAEALGSYPLREAEIVPVTHAALEGPGEWHDGLIRLSESYYRLSFMAPPPAVKDPWLKRVMTDDADQERRETISHELAHAWWGYLIRSDRSRGRWWEEGIAEAASIAAVERAYGADAAKALRDGTIFDYQRWRLNGVADIAPGEPPRDKAALPEYKMMQYDKPALFYEKVRALMGDDAYFAALRRYMEARRHTVAADRGPVEELLGAPGVAELYQRWMLETHGDEDIGLLTEEQIKQIAP